MGLTHLSKHTTVVEERCVRPVFVVVKIFLTGYNVYGEIVLFKGDV